MIYSNIPDHIFDDIVPIPEELTLDERLISFHGMNPFVANNSSARGTMMSNHDSQRLIIRHGDVKIIQTGYEYQFANNTFKVKFDCDAKILRVIKRYGDVSLGIPISPSIYIFYQNIQTGEIGKIELNKHFNLHQHFGMELIWNKDIIENLKPGMVFNKGTILADTITVGENGDYKPGVNINVAYIPIPDVSEDAIVISEEKLANFAFDMYETRFIEYGGDKFPLNILGTVDEYKPYANIGEKIGPNSMLMALRTENPDIAFGQLSRSELMRPNPLFDECTYVRGPGEEYTINVNGEPHKIISGYIEDIKVYYTPKHKRNNIDGGNGSTSKYVIGLQDYYNRIHKAYLDIKSQYVKPGDRLNITEDLHQSIIEAQAITSSGKTKLTYRNDALDTYRLEFIIRYTVIPYIGCKLSTYHGGKGVITDIKPRKDMPKDLLGNVSDMVMCPTTIPSRMNIGTLYEQYFNGMSRHVKKMIMEMYITDDPTTIPDNVILQQFVLLLEFLEIIGTEQFVYYNNTYINNDMSNMRSIIEEIYIKELYLLYKVSSKRKPFQIVRAIRKTKFAPPRTVVTFNFNGEEETTKTPIRIAPLYIIALNKTPQHMLAVPAAKTNHYGIAVSSGGNTDKDRLPIKFSPVKSLSETEVRMYTAYGASLVLIAELKHLANSPITLKAIYWKLLSAPQPTNIKLLIDRNVIPYGDDAAMTFVEKLLKPAGISMKYVPDREKNNYYGKGFK